MTNLDKWKQERIKEIEDMDIDDVAGAMDCGCDYCEFKHSSSNYEDYKCFCEEDCYEGIKAYLDMEVEE